MSFPGANARLRLWHEREHRRPLFCLVIARHKLVFRVKFFVSSDCVRDDLIVHDLNTTFTSHNCCRIPSSASGGYMALVSLIGEGKPSTRPAASFLQQPVRRQASHQRSKNILP